MIYTMLQVFGDITTPQQIQDSYGQLTDLNKGGLIGLVSNIIKLIMIVGGLWAFINLIIAGITYVTSGDNPDELKKANDKMVKSLIGLVIMFGSFTIAGIIGWLFFKDASALLNPKIYTPGP